MVHVAKKFISARDLLHQECSDKFKQTNKSDARASIRSIVVGKGKIMSFEDIEDVRAKRKKREVAQARRRGRKGKYSTSKSVPRRSKQTRAENWKRQIMNRRIRIEELLFRLLSVIIIGRAYYDRCCCSIYCYRWHLVCITE